MAGFTAAGVDAGQERLSRQRLSKSALAKTLTLDSAMAAPAKTGFK